MTADKTRIEHDDEHGPGDDVEIAYLYCASSYRDFVNILKPAFPQWVKHNWKSAWSRYRRSLILTATAYANS
jgi:hypothetical protein